MAQTDSVSATSDVVRYPAADFAAYYPQTALDMVRRTPGFVLAEGDEEIRGYAATGGNVLIDGARPTSKAGVIDALSRIAASQVDRIELIRNASTSEAQGRALVLNLVTTKRSVSGTWSAEVERNGNGTVYPRLDVSYARPVGGWETSLRFNSFWEEFPFRSTRLLRDASGTLLTATQTDLPSTLTETYLSGDAKRGIAGGILTLTGRIGRYYYYFDQPGQTYIGRLPDGQPDRTQLTRYSEKRWDLEFGADYARDIDGWNWKTVGLLTAKDGVETQSDTQRDATGALLSNTMVDATALPIELVARSSFARIAGDRFKPEFGIEAAYNRRDSTFALSVDDGTGPSTIEIPGADVRVEELRAEVFGTLKWTITPRLSMETELAAETSRISVSGDAQRSQTFAFLKPAAALAFRANERVQSRIGVRRLVGQLDFGDFAASASLNDGTAIAGNPDLGPDQTTRYYAAVDYRGAGDLAWNLEVFHEDRQDVLEQVVLPSGAVGLANAGDATYRGAKGSLTLPLDVLLDAARLTLKAQVLDSEFDDPVTGESRPLSRVYSPELTVEFRHDPAALRFSWGVDWEAGYQGDVYRVVEIDRLNLEDNFGGFIETSALGPFKARLAIRNADVLRSSRERSFFAPDRSGVVVRTEDRQQYSPAFYTFTLSGSF